MTEGSAAVQMSFLDEDRSSYDEELQACYDRHPNTEENKWLDERDLPHPDRVLCGVMFDPGLRSLEHLRHPFPSNDGKQWKGCYLWYGTNEHGLIPAYAGKTAHFQIRASQHWSGTSGWIDQFASKYYESDAFGETGSDIWCAVWYFESEKKRTSFEHMLIGHAEPLYNKQ